MFTLPLNQHQKNKTLKQVLGDTGRFIGKQYLDNAVINPRVASADPSALPLSYDVNLCLNKYSAPDTPVPALLSKTVQDTITNYTDRVVPRAALVERNKGLSAEEAVKRTKEDIVKKNKAIEDNTDYDNKPRERLFGGKNKRTKKSVLKKILIKNVLKLCVLNAVKN